jgi:hypothetical protein
VEKRSVSHVALAVSAAAVLVALVFLVFQVRASAPREGLEPAVRPDPPPPPPAAEEVARSAPPPAPAPAAAEPVREAPRPSMGARLGRAARRAAERVQAEARGESQPTEGGADGDSSGAGDRTATGSGPSSGDTPADRAAALVPADRPDLAEGIQTAMRSYNQGDYEAARTAAMQILAQKPDDRVSDKMLRIAVTASCFLGDTEKARSLLPQLSPDSQRQMERRCRRAGIQF